MAKYIVNHGGVVHSVNDDEFALHLGLASLKPSDGNPAGSPAREATAEEVAAWFTAQGLPVPDEFAPKSDEGGKADNKASDKASK